MSETQTQQPNGLGLMSYPKPHPLHAEATAEDKSTHNKALALHTASLQTITVKEGKDTKVIHPIAVAWRNEVAVPLYPMDVARAKKGSDKEGFSYPSVHVQWAKDNASKFLDFVGIPTVIRWGSSKVKQIAQTLAEEACEDKKDDAGKVVYRMVKGKPDTDDPLPDYTTFDLAAFIPMFEDLSPRSETLAEINEAITGLAEEMSNLDIMDYIAKAGGNAELGVVSYKKDMDNLKSQVMSYKVAKDKKKRHKTTTLEEGGEIADMQDAEVNS